MNAAIKAEASSELEAAGCGGRHDGPAGPGGITQAVMTQLGKSQAESAKRPPGRAARSTVTVDTRCVVTP